MYLGLRGRLLASTRIVADSGGRNEEFEKSRWSEIEAEVEGGWKDESVRSGSLAIER